MNIQQEVGSNALIFNSDGKFLLVKRADTDEYFAGFWELPGGGVDGDETPQKSLEREVFEECGLSITIGQPLCVHIFTLKNDTIKVTEITFLCKLQNPGQEVTLSFEHSEYKWVTKEDIERLELSDYMKALVKDAFTNPLVTI